MSETQKAAEGLVERVAVAIKGGLTDEFYSPVTAAIAIEAVADWLDDGSLEEMNPAEQWGFLEAIHRLRSHVSGK